MELTCPKMKTLTSQTPSLLPFEISASKRGMFSMKIPNEQLAIDPVVRNLTPDQKFWRKSLAEKEKLPTNENGDWVKSPPQPRLRVLPTSSEMISNLGFIYNS